MRLFAASIVFSVFVMMGMPFAHLNEAEPGRDLAGFGSLVASSDKAWLVGHFRGF